MRRVLPVYVLSRSSCFPFFLFFSFFHSHYSFFFFCCYALSVIGQTRQSSLSPLFGFFSCLWGSLAQEVTVTNVCTPHHPHFPSTPYPLGLFLSSWHRLHRYQTN
ncbi:hypothetical protein B0F90DRAFT_1775597, partial [Multifurca ochricompacta]